MLCAAVLLPSFAAAPPTLPTATLATPPPPPAPNPLAGLPELPKLHYLCEGIADEYIDADANDGIIVDYARIAGSIAVDMKNQSIVTNAVKICDAASKASNTSRSVGLGLNFGCMPGGAASVRPPPARPPPLSLPSSPAAGTPGGGVGPRPPTRD